ncbi:MAG TPA: endonuclease domain-containing protein [Candidatus Woesebacteria bacterium]|nr:endonuclease domain-containing protein [Candidatus Woesebacteria bacterium]
MTQVDFEAIHTERGCVRYWNSLTQMANRNQKNPTEAEKKMWNNYLSRNKTGFRFLRQKPIHRFIVDFYCVKLSLAIEIDGNSHDKKKEIDEERDKFLKQIGIKTIRFTNEDILNNSEYIKKILNPLLLKRG